MKSTIVINRIIVHYADIQSNLKTYSDFLLDLETDMIDYYKKKIEKMIESNKKERLFNPNNQKVENRFKEMCGCNDEEFIEYSKLFLDEFFYFAMGYEDVPNFNLMCVDCDLDGVQYIFVAKLNHAQGPKNNVSETVTENNETKIKVNITSDSLIPPKSKPIEEAIIYNENDEFEIIQKKFTCGDTKSFYINDEYLKGDIEKSSKEALDNLTAAINSVEIDTSEDDDKSFDEVLDNPLLKMKSTLTEEYLNDEPHVNIFETVGKIFEEKPTHGATVRNILRDKGYDDHSIITELPSLNKLEKCELKINGDIKIVIPLDKLHQSECFEIIEKDSGDKDIIIKNIYDLKIK